MVVEACVDSLESAQAAVPAGAHRIELCASLETGGLTPDPALVTDCLARVDVPVHVMIRPRAGDFVVSNTELDLMLRDIDTARALGAHGVVLGLLTPAGGVDVARTRVLVERARPLSVTFHRAFDETRDLEEALADLVSIGVDRVLTAGGAPSAAAGAARLASLVPAAGDAIVIMAGGGVRGHNVRAILSRSGVREVHARCEASDPDPFRGLVGEVRDVAARTPAR